MHGKAEYLGPLLAADFYLLDARAVHAHDFHLQGRSVFAVAREYSRGDAVTGLRHAVEELQRQRRQRNRVIGMCVFRVAQNRFIKKSFLQKTFGLTHGHTAVEGDSVFIEYARVGFAPHDNAFTTIFFCLTGLHGAHVFVGLTILLFATIRAFRGHFDSEHYHGVELPGIYWHFVDVMWIVVYTTVYIL